MSIGSGSNRDLSETFQELLGTLAKILLWIGIVGTVVGAGFLVFTCSATANASPAVLKQAMANIDILEKVLFAGVIALGVSSTFLMWGEQILGALQLIFAALLYTAPLWLPSAFGNLSEAGTRAAGSLQTGGLIFGLIAIVVLIADLATRMRQRVTKGAKASQFKYGKGIKEEADKQNVFLGKCWQLPYCRKFVRDKCPIYHAKRSCWRELVGCMCEEEVIRGAMENRVIPKDALLAANLIPRNNRLTVDQKKERCKSCVIYNEHQKHKYSASVPGTLAAFALVYILLHGPLIETMRVLVERMSGVVNNFSYGASSKAVPTSGWFVEGLLAVVFIILLSYALKILEYLIFELKV